jgi:hypothetical protein
MDRPAVRGSHNEYNEGGLRRSPPPPKTMATDALACDFIVGSFFEQCGELCRDTLFS